jgi:LysM repeat protein
MKTFLALPLPLILLLAGPTVAQLEPVALTQPALPVSAGLLWVKVRKPITIEELASSLRQDESSLAKLNGVNEDHQFKSGDWLVLPSQSSRLVKQLAAVDTSDLRRTPPLQSPPETADPARVRHGDSLAKIAERYNLSIAELLRLNPSLQAARLVVGTQIDVAQSAPGRNRMVLGLAPTGSGGLGLPDQPEFAPNRTASDRFEISLDELVRSGLEACLRRALSSTECRGLLRGRTPVTGLRWPSNPLGLDV